MYTRRNKTSSVYKDFLEELRRSRRFDSENNANYVAGKLSKRNLYLLTESVFFTAFREYENFIRDLFILYAKGVSTSKGKKVNSYLQPKNFSHTEALIKSSMPFLDWNSPDTIISRAELYLRNGFPVKLPYTANRTEFSKYKKLRNHIAHNSKESLEEYLKVLRAHFTVTPLTIPSVGEYLLLTSRTDPLKYNLLVFFDKLESIANDLT